MIRLNQAIAVCILASFLLPTITVHATTYYVATTGSDANTCVQAQTTSRPKQTIPAGVACLSGGDTLIIKAGTYINQEITNPPAGSASAFTIIKGDPTGTRPVLVPDGTTNQRGFYCSKGESCHFIEIRYIEVTKALNSVKLYGDATVGYPHHVSLIDNIFHDTLNTNVLIHSSPSGFIGGDHLIQGNTFYRTGSGRPDYPPGHNTIYNTGNRSIIERNVFHNLANGIGIWASGLTVQNVIIRNNVFYEIGRSNTDTWQQGNGSFTAVHISVPGGGHKIYNNIVYNSGDDSRFIAFKVWRSTPTDINEFYNNTVYDIKNPDAHSFWVQATTGMHIIKNNIAFLGGTAITGGMQSNNLTTDPLFKDPAKANFSLRGTSPAIDAGVPTVPTDFAGTPRPQGAGYDIGAYEAGAGDAPMAPKGLVAR
jgi:hypothetical protein